MIDARLKKLFCRVWLRPVLHLLIRMCFHLGCLALGSISFESGFTTTAFLFLLPHFAASSFLGWAGLGHELFHKSVFPSGRLNVALFRIFSIYTWSNYAWFEITHPLHHRRTLASDDPEKLGVKPVAFLECVQWLTVDVTGFCRRVTVLARNAAGIVPIKRNGSEGGWAPSAIQKAQIARGAWVVLGVNISLAAYFIITNNVFLIFGITFAPFFLTFFNKILSMSQHYGLFESPDGRYEMSCRTVTLGWIGGFFYANMNYHIEHHYYPGMPFYNLSKAHDYIFGGQNNIYRGNVVGSFPECIRLILLPQKRK